MDTIAEVKRVDESAAENMALVALTPAEMPDQQRALAEWCTRKIDAVQRELATFRALEEEAKVGGFRHATYTALVRKAEKRIVYYQKIQQAVEAGYLIVPNMPVNVFAVRVNPDRKPSEQSSTWNSGFRAKPQALPPGEGQYVDESLNTGSRRYNETNAKGEVVTRTQYFSTDYDEEVDFPLRGVHPRVLQATSRAMALKLFDQLAVVQNGGGRDPIVVGQLLDPRGQSRLTTFFVAWWLNTADL